MGKKANAEDVRVALEYYTRDDLACSIQSPNKKDVVKAMINDNKTKVVKRFMTRSVKETYQLFGKDHPHRELGISKFYSLRPKWVKKSPEHEETFTEDDFKRIYLCSPPQNDCFLRRCEKCPKMQSISLQSLHLDEDEEICYALWDAGELVKKNLSPRSPRCVPKHSGASVAGNATVVACGALAAQSRRGDRSDSASSEYQIILPPLPTGPTVLNTVFLHTDVRGRPYRVEDFCDTLSLLALLPEVVTLKAYQMNHVWAVTFKSPEGERKILAAGDIVVKGRRRVIVEPANRDVRVKTHWLLHYVPEDEVRVALAPYGQVIDVGTEKWRVQGVMGCGSMTRTAVIRLKPGIGLKDLPHQLRIAGGPALVVAPGRPPLCLRCQRTGLTRRDCLVPKCASCHRFGHVAESCIRTYAAATCSGGEDANAEHVMDEADIQEALEGAASLRTNTEVDRVASEQPLTVVAPSSVHASTENRDETPTNNYETATRNEPPTLKNEGPQSNSAVPPVTKIHMGRLRRTVEKKYRYAVMTGSVDGEGADLWRRRSRSAGRELSHACAKNDVSYEETN
ncbi:hypothetical protein ISCGN_009418 [Ixodes scapularis]